jgi:hypothetical protein
MPRSLSIQFGLVWLLAFNSVGLAEDFTFFEQRIRPVLVKQCYECHSAQSKSVKGGLLLDSRAGLLRGGDSGPAMAPGKPDESLLIKALRHEDFEMPPAGKLAESVIDDFGRWVREGAPDPREEVAAPAARRAEPIDVANGRKYWSFTPPRPVDPPTTRDTVWPASDVDRFVLAKLETEGFTPSPDADRAALLRRATFDLTGLPPTPNELANFVADMSPDAFAKVVDRLLATPQFGERWGRHWLDVVRFAESSGGGRSLVFGSAWRYRDYVIRSFNADKPFDRFLTEQLAGDLLPAGAVAEAQDQVLASAFWMLGPINYEEQDHRVLEMDRVDEQLDTMGRALLGLTLGCARCHDHKFDPIPTRDYYALAGILRSTDTLVHHQDANSTWTERPLPLDAAAEREWAADVAQVAALEGKIRAAKERLGADFASSNKSPSKGALPVKALPGIVLDDTEAKQIGVWRESTFIGPFIGQGYLTDDGKNKGQMTLTFVPQFPRAGLYEVRFAYTAADNRCPSLPIDILSLDGEASVRIDERRPPTIGSRFESLGRYRFDDSGQWYVRISNENTQGSITVDALQFLPVDETQAATTATTAPSADAALVAEIEALEKQLPAIKQRVAARPIVMSAKEGAIIEDCALRIRGNAHQLGERIPRGFLQVAYDGPALDLTSLESGRLQLANWITRPDHPLTARVIVNRVWSHLFGMGLVRTVDNFGRAGEAPSHPELLDYVTLRFVRDGWSIKRLIRELMLSHVYRQTSAARPDLAAVDPDNRWLGRMNRRRLEAEAIRDAMLQASGRLDLTVGGATIRFPKETKKTNEANAIEYGYVFDDARRSVYTPVFRNKMLELFETFDYADANNVLGQRTTSTVAPQALFMLNSPFANEQARHMAETLLSADFPSDAERLDFACRATLGRTPTDAERQTLWAKLPQNAEGNDDSANSDARLTAWRQICQALFACLDFRFVD